MTQHPLADRVAQLFSEGLSGPQIGQRLGVSKGVVSGVKHRAGIGGPKKPLSDSPRAREARYYRAMKKGLPVREEDRVKRPSEARKPQPPRAPRVVYIRKGPASACCYPIGDPGTVSFRFCDAAAKPGGSYCGDHHAICYSGRGPRL